MLNVLITIDTEVYPLLPDWRADNLSRDIQRDIYGQTPRGAFGLSYQLEVLKRFALKGVFFVEGLFASAVGFGPLREIVRQVNRGGHEIQLHLHPEWLAFMAEPPVQPGSREVTNQFSKDEQTQLISLAARNLKDAGVQRITAFRAGDYAANADTLQALLSNEITYDSSCNPCYNCSFPGSEEFRDITQPKVVSGVCEVPVSYWMARPFGRRHAQLCSSSAAEMQAALWHAARQNWQTFVIVSHSFELLKKRRQRIDRPVPDLMVVSRFEELCRFLHEHQDKFRTCGFNDLSATPAPGTDHQLPFSAPPLRTALRVLQQLYRRLT